jgi:hypothetical protein
LAPTQSGIRLGLRWRVLLLRLLIALRRSPSDVVPKPMPLYWLCYRHNNQISVVIEPGASPIHARMRAVLAGLDEGELTEGHELDRKMRVPKEMIGRRLSQEEAKRLLAKFVPVRRDKAALSSGCEIPSGERSSRKQPVQLWRSRSG